MTTNPSLSLRTEHVGSLLRPRILKEARQKYDQGLLRREDLTEYEDRAIARVLRFQESLGLDVVTDGEYRRVWFGESLALAVDGLADGQPRPTGRRGWVGETEDLSKSANEETNEALAASRGQFAAQKLQLRSRILENDTRFLANHATRTFKVTTMAPTAQVERLFVPGATDAYPRGVDLLREIGGFLVSEVDKLADEGLPYFQLDSLAYILRFGDEEQAQRLTETLGVSRKSVVDEILAVDNEILDAARARGVITGVHMCRGNSRSAWNPLAGTYDVAIQALEELRTDRLLLEYDTDRAGGFSPLSHVPDTAVVVLGLISSKFPRLETRDELLARIDEASQFHPIESLALSPQCGFASTLPGNLVTWSDQQRKLERLVEVAAEVWG